MSEFSFNTIGSVMKYLCILNTVYNFITFCIYLLKLFILEVHTHKHEGFLIRIFFFRNLFQDSKKSRRCL